MGVVYKARQTGLNRLVALKMIIGGSQVREHHLARFRIEAEAVAQLRHPNIVQIYDIGEVDGMPFVSLEFLEGGDLDDRLAGTPQPGRSGRRADGDPGPGHSRRPSSPDRSPRPQAGQRALDRRRRAQDHRLRAGQAAGIGRSPDADRRHHGHAQLHGSRAGPGTHQGRRPGRRHLRPRARSSTRS